jgi:hypothetical protein
MINTHSSNQRSLNFVVKFKRTTGNIAESFANWLRNVENRVFNLLIFREQRY